MPNHSWGRHPVAALTSGSNRGAPACFVSTLVQIARSQESASDGFAVGEILVALPPFLASPVEWTSSHLPSGRVVIAGRSSTSPIRPGFLRNGQQALSGAASTSAANRVRVMPLLCGWRVAALAACPLTCGSRHPTLPKASSSQRRPCSVVTRNGENTDGVIRAVDCHPHRATSRLVSPGACEP